MSRKSRFEAYKPSKADITPGNRKLRQKSLSSKQDENTAGIPPIVPEVLHSEGKPLDSATRNTMESYFNRDFSQVRTHTDTKAARSAEVIDARAYSLGQDIVFGEGAFAPDETEGKKLLAHELAHVTQQTDESTELPTSPDSLSVGNEADAEEHAAQQAADRMVAREDGDAIANQASSSSQPSSGLIRRQEVPGQEIPGNVDPTLRVSPFWARAMGSLILEDFAIDSAVLTSAHQAQIDDLAETILRLRRQYPAATLSVVGHTDATGSEAHNMTLGQQRADAVRDALVAAGVPAEIIFTSSRGEESLRVETQRHEGRNRRVEVIFQPEPLARLDIPPLTLEPEQPPLDLQLDLPIQPETPEERIERILTTPVPELPPRRSFNEMFWERVNEGLDDIMDTFNIPESWRDLIRRAARAGIERGAQEILEQALDSADIHGEAREAIEAAVRAAMETPVVP